MDSIVRDFIELLKTGCEWRGRDTLILDFIMVTPHADYNLIMSRLFDEMRQENWQEFIDFAKKRGASTDGLQQLQELLAAKGVTVEIDH